MFNILGYLNFNCILTYVNLILILIFNAGSISFDACQLTIFNKLKNFSEKVPIISTLNLAFQSFSFGMGILVFFFKNCKDLKIINKIIVISGKILKILSIILSLADFILLIDEFTNIDDNYFLNSDVKFGEDSQNYSTYNRFEDLNKISDLPFIINGNKFIIEDFEKFKIVDTSFEKKRYKDISGYDGNNNEFTDRVFAITFMIIDGILILLSGFNWGSVEKKIGKLVDGRIDSRTEDISEEPNFLVKSVRFLIGKKFIIITIIFFIVEFILFMVVFIFGKPNWAQNNIIGSCMAFDLGSCIISLIFGFPLYKTGNFNYCSILLLVILLFFYTGNLYTIILSFYALYHSYKGKTFFYYFCYKTDILCDGLFQINSSDIINSYREIEFDYVYYKIFICPTKNSILIFLIITRVIVLIWNLYRLGSCIFYISNSGKVETIKKIIDFIRNKDGTIIDFDKIEIEEIVETVKGIKNGKETEKKITKLMQKILPSENYGNQVNNNPDYNNAINNNNALYINNNNINSDNRIMNLNFSKEK